VSILNTSRRRFLQAGAAASTVPLAARAGLAAAPILEPPAACIVEAGCSEALEFGAHFRRNGVALHEIRDDVTPVWYRHLDQRWRARPLIVAGLTRRPALFCLEQLAWQHGMRVMHHAVHQADGERHELLSESQVPAASDLYAAGSSWPTELAAALLTRREAHRNPGPSSAYQPTFRDRPEMPLHSWVIAPVMRREYAA
jgi:hypothetical protein